MRPEQLSFSCDAPLVHETEYGGEEASTPSEAVVDALAAVEDVEPTTLDPLYDTVDLEAIDSLFAGTDDPAHVVGIAVEGWHVVVRGDGVVRVCDPDAAEVSSSAVSESVADD